MMHQQDRSSSDIKGLSIVILWGDKLHDTAMSPLLSFRGLKLLQQHRAKKKTCLTVTRVH